MFTWSLQNKTLQKLQELKPVAHLLNTDYDMIIIALTLQGGKNKLA